MPPRMKLVSCGLLLIFGTGCVTDRYATLVDRPANLGVSRENPAPTPDSRTSVGDDRTTSVPAPVRRSPAIDLSTLAGDQGVVAWVDRWLQRARWEERSPAIPDASEVGGAAALSLPSGGVGSGSTSGTAAASDPGGGSVTGSGGATPDGGGGESGTTSRASDSGAVNAVSGNPAAVNILVGTGRLGDFLGVNHDGIRFGGLNITDANGNLAGGLGPGKWVGDTLTIADLSIDLEKMVDWKGGLFGTQFLYYNGFGGGYTINGVEQGKNSPNALAGSVMGFNALDAGAPYSRAELYQLWFRQEFFDDKLIVRIGKSVPTYDFDNVLRDWPIEDPQAAVPAISGALFKPIYINPTMLSVLPGYYNSATGLVVSAIPTKYTYLQYGFFDGNLARGEQTGFDGPRFNGYYLHLLEAGLNWTLAKDDKPGKFGAGVWFQTGKLMGLNGRPEEGATGMYLFGSQRLYFEKPKSKGQGLVSWMQFGATNADISQTQRYFGFGLSYFGPIPNRDEDSCGFGLAYGTMNPDPQAGSSYFPNDNLRTTQLGSSETILTWYYQMKLRDGLYIQPNLSYIPAPAEHPGIPAAFDFTLRGIVLF